MRVWLMAAVALTACGYRGGSFAGPRGAFAGERVTVGCLDVAVAAVHDAAAEGPAIAYEFGNRCDRPARVDLTAVAVRGRTATGHEVALAPFDPLLELRPARFEARRSGGEVFVYHANSGEAVRLVCADVGAIDDGGGGRREICVDGGGP
jgi:hypothetical protein